MDRVHNEGNLSPIFDRRLNHGRHAFKGYSWKRLFYFTTTIEFSCADPRNDDCSRHAPEDAMPLNPSTEDSLRRLFYQGFAAHDLAEPLRSFDDTTSSTEVRRYMSEHRFLVVGVRHRGMINGYVELHDLGEGTCGEHEKPFSTGSVIHGSASLLEVITGLDTNLRLFVSMLGQVGGIITRTDLQKPPFRMWLFGMVTLVEMRLSRVIEEFCPDDGWKQYLSEGRIEKAEALLAERARRNQHLRLSDCLQLSDKGQILARNPELRTASRFSSRRKVEEAAKGFERLRNNLAHAQDIISSDWQTIVDLTSDIESIITGPEGWRDFAAAQPQPTISTRTQIEEDRGDDIEGGIN